jgi:hypothetical protein
MKAFSRVQFALIDALFLRPGFQSLVEFGWSIYYKQPEDINYSNIIQGNGEVIYQDVPFSNTISNRGFHEFGSSEDTEAFTLLQTTGTAGNISPTIYQIGEAIRRDKRKYAGNYDGHLAKITNFKWNLESDGSYSIQVQLTAIGDVIESMKMNVGAGSAEGAREILNQAQAQADAEAAEEAEKNVVDNAKGGPPASEVSAAVSTVVEVRGPENQNLLVEANRFKSLFNQYLFDLDKLSSIVFAKGSEAAEDAYPELFNKETGARVQKGANVTTVQFPLTFPDFPRPYKATNIVFDDNIVEGAITGRGIQSKNIVQDRSTPTNFVDLNGALRLQLTDASTVDKTGQLNNVFLSFSSLCAYVQSNLILYDFTNGKKTPVFYFDDSIYNIDVDLQRAVNFPTEGETGEEIHYKDYHRLSSINRWKDKTYMFTFPGQFSSRPDICVIPVINLPAIVDGDVSFIANGKNNLFLQKTAFSCATQLSKPSQYLGDLGAVYFNTSYLSNLVADLTSNGNVSVLEFFETILSDMTNALGNVNEISVFVTDSGEITFYENKPQRFDDGTGTALEDDFTVLNVFGVKPGDDVGDPNTAGLTFEQERAIRLGDTTIPKGSIVRSFGLSTTIPQSLTTMIAVSAQANPNQPSSDATAFGEYSIGLEDSLLPQKANNVPAQTGDFEGEFYALVTGSNFTLTEEDLARSVRVKDFISDNQPFFQIGRKFYDDTGVMTPTELDTLQEFNTQYANFVQGELSKIGQTRSNFFLPFNLKLTLDGIAGIKNFSKFAIETKALPLSYSPDDNGSGGVEIVVNAVNHTIDQNGWVTELDTISSTLKSLQPVSPSAPLTALPPPPPRPDTGVAFSYTPPPPMEPPSPPEPAGTYPANFLLCYQLYFHDYISRSSWETTAWGRGPGGRSLTCATLVSNAHRYTFQFFYGPDSTLPADVRLTQEEIDRMWLPDGIIDNNKKSFRPPNKGYNGLTWCPSSIYQYYKWGLALVTLPNLKPGDILFNYGEWHTPSHIQVVSERSTFNGTGNGETVGNQILVYDQHSGAWPGNGGPDPKYGGNPGKRCRGNSYSSNPEPQLPGNTNYLGAAHFGFRLSNAWFYDRLTTDLGITDNERLAGLIFPDAGVLRISQFAALKVEAAILKQNQASRQQTDDLRSFRASNNIVYGGGGEE